MCLLYFSRPISNTRVRYRVRKTEYHDCRLLGFACKFLAKSIFSMLAARIARDPGPNYFSPTILEWLLRHALCACSTWILLQGETRAMIMTNKLLPVALIAALIGGSVGALVMHRSQPASAETATATQTNTAPAATEQQANNELVPSEFNTAGEQTAYKTGFADGFAAASETAVNTSSARRSPSRVVYRNSGSRASSSRVYYDYQPRKRSFWDKHRDKLTVAIGTGAGAAIGGLVGGKKGAAIGALSGAGGSALWTYKLRKRNRNY